MSAKFINTVLKVASVVTVPLAMLAASVPASAQRPGQRSHSAWHYNNGRSNNGHLKKSHFKNKRYKNGQYRNGRDNRGYDNDRDNDRDNGHDNNGSSNNGHLKKSHFKNKRYKNGQYRNGRDNRGYDNDRDNDRDNGHDNNGSYNNGRYGNGQYGQYPQYPQQVIVQRPVYGTRGVAGKSLPVSRRGNGYPSSSATRYPSTAIPGFPNPIAQNRSGKALPGTSQQNRQYDARHRGY